MMTYQQSADATATYRETSGVNVSRLSSAAVGREPIEALGGATVIPTSHTVLSPIRSFGSLVHVPHLELAATSEVVGDLRYVQSPGMNCSAKSARTSLT
ncbi:hypothetical protein FV242_08240 [Methylobacterium sp. WL64]|uniref:hypothetical protein n=1 Tax=Methylobacterium sp. WL64 TaxID=2603894 RepID=UPI0011C7B9C9|nr:hypothetical protein [Methylobacterium sp. WL64]TXN04194.1 hypothetical protein FV242_08240 [Methylobacterium sp. WL64]